MESRSSTAAVGTRRLSWGRGLLLAALLVAAGTEIALRVDDRLAGRDASFYLPRDEIRLYRPHPYLGFVLEPGQHRTRGYPVTVNALGMRGRELPAHKPPGTYRIFCLGGSTTFGTGASGDTTTYPAQLERLLNESAGGEGAPLRYEVGNCGVVDWNSADNLINLELRLLDYEPDAIVYYEAANDGRVAQLEGFVPDFSHARQPWALVIVSPLERFLLTHLRTYARLTRGTDPQEQYASLDTFVFRRDVWSRRIDSSASVNEEGVRTFIRNLTSLVAVARASRIDVLLSTFAMRSPDTPGRGEQQPEFLHRANEALRALAREQDLPLIDVDRALSGKPEIFADFMHLNDAGELRHAEVVRDRALELGLLGLRPAR